MNKFLLILSSLTLISSMATQSVDQAGLDLIMHFEGFRSDFYSDQVGARSIGYGHCCQTDGANCANITAPLSQSAALELLKSDLSPRESCVASVITSSLPSNSFSALVSLAFNIGCEAFASSQLVTCVNGNSTQDVPQAFSSLAAAANGQILSDLVIRRQAEVKLFCSNGLC